MLHKGNNEKEWLTQERYETSYKVACESVHMQSASTTSEAIDVLKKWLQQELAMDSYMYDQDLTAAK